MRVPTAAALPLLSLQHVTKRYDGAAGAEPALILDDITLTIDRGEMVAIMGPSGSGKSTLLHIMGCLDQPSSGDYRVAGRSTAALSADALAALRRVHFGFIFQRYHLLPNLSALENVALPAGYGAMPAAQRQRRARQLLDRFGLGDRVAHRPAALSGGQQQRVSIARALINGGAVILADEPTGALDSQSGSEVIEQLLELHRAGHTVILVTHDTALAARAQRIIEIGDGRVLSDRRSAAPLALPNDGFLPETIGVAHVAPGWRGCAARVGELGMSAWLTLLRHRLRTLLTLLSITMGVASVVTMVAAGAGASDKLADEIRTWGADLIYLLPGSGLTDTHPERARPLGRADIDLLDRYGARSGPGTAANGEAFIDAISPFVRSTSILRRGKVSGAATVRGGNEHLFTVRNRRFVDGRGFHPEEIRRGAAVAVIDETTRNTFFPHDATPLGQRLLLGRVPVVVIGVTADDAGDAGVQAALTAFVPVTLFNTRLRSSASFDALEIKLREKALTTFAQAETRIAQLLTQRRGRKDFFLVSVFKQLEAQRRNARMMAIMMAVIGLISLTVAGIGVMNIMLVAVKERTAEIGIRMAVGARRADIRDQFLAEAALVCTLGGMAGVLFSLVIHAAVLWLMPEVPLRLSIDVIAAACLTSTLVGIGFGYFPARNAARMTPVHALAH